MEPYLEERKDFVPHSVFDAELAQAKLAEHHLAKLAKAHRTHAVGKAVCKVDRVDQDAALEAAKGLLVVRELLDAHSIEVLADRILPNGVAAGIFERPADLVEHMRGRDLCQELVGVQRGHKRGPVNVYADRLANGALEALLKDRQRLVGARHKPGAPARRDAARPPPRRARAPVLGRRRRVARTVRAKD